MATTVATLGILARFLHSLPDLARILAQQLKGLSWSRENHNMWWLYRILRKGVCLCLCLEWASLRQPHASWKRAGSVSNLVEQYQLALLLGELRTVVYVSHLT